MSETGYGKMYTPAEAAEIIGCSVATIRKALKVGELAYIALSKRLFRIRESDLVAYLESKGIKRSE